MNGMKYFSCSGTIWRTPSGQTVRTESDKDATKYPLLPDVTSEEQSPQGMNESLVIIDNWLIWENKLMFDYKEQTYRFIIM